MEEKPLTFTFTPQSRDSAIINLLIENIASTYALQEFLFEKLMDMSDCVNEPQKQFNGFLQIQHDRVTEYKAEIVALVMSKYSQ